MQFLKRKNPAKDAAKIHNTIDYKVLRAAWDTYVRIKKTGFQQTHSTATPAWFGLFAIQNHEGKFDRFDTDELHLLKAFTATHNACGEIITTLSENKADSSLAEHIMATHPNLQETVPEKHHNPDRIIEYITQVVKTYQKMLQEYYMRYKEEIDGAINRLEKSGTARPIDASHLPKKETMTNDEEEHNA